MSVDKFGMKACAVLLFVFIASCSTVTQPAVSTLPSSPSPTDNDGTITKATPETTPTPTTVPTVSSSPTNEILKRTPTATATTVETPATTTRLIKQHEWTIPLLINNHIIWAPNEDRFVVFTMDAAEMYDAGSAQRLWRIEPPYPAADASAAVFSPDGKHLILYRSSSGIEIRNADSGQLLAGDPEGENNGCWGEAFGVAMAPDNQTLYVAVDSTLKGVWSATIYKWDLSSLLCLGEFAKLSGFRNYFGQSSDGRYMAVGIVTDSTYLGDDRIAEEGQTWVWDLETEEKVCALNKPLVSFFPQTNVIMAAGDNKLYYWVRELCEISKEVEVAEIREPFALAVSPEGPFLAMSRYQIWVVELLSDDLLLTMNELPLKEITDSAHSLYDNLSFSMSGRFLLFTTKNPENPFEMLLILWRIENS